jgi:hypothetical protein
VIKTRFKKKEVRLSPKIERPNLLVNKKQEKKAQNKRGLETRKKGTKETIKRI